MDRITTSLLHDFSAEYGINQLEEDKRFECLTTYTMLKRHYIDAFDLLDVIVGDGGDTGIDGVAIIVNNRLVTDVEDFEETFGSESTLEIGFVFVQSERSSNFDASKIGTFGFGVEDLFLEEGPRLVRNERIAATAEIVDAIYEKSSRFRRGNPSCWMYYVTTGRVTNDPVLEARRLAVIADLEALGLFGKVEFSLIGASELQRLYQHTKNAITKEFVFSHRIVIPDIQGVDESYLGYIPANIYIKLLEDDTGEIAGGLFYENVRDWQDYNKINSEIRATLQSEASGRFVLMNNGITIIAARVRTTSNKFTIEDYQIVNGCQTSHVLFDNKDYISDRIMVPVRLIGTTDEDVISSIIRATNRQTAVKDEQFIAIQDFSKKLEQYFTSFPSPHKLFYERRSRQYSRQNVEKTRIVIQDNVIKATAAMFLNEPHRTTRNYAAILSKIGQDIFAQEHKPDPYYVAALCLYKVEYLIRNKRLDSKYRSARFHILLAIRLLCKPEPLPSWNSRAMERYCEVLMNELWDSAKADNLISRAAAIVDEAAQDNFDRDYIRTEPFTRKVISICQAQE